MVLFIPLRLPSLANSRMHWKEMARLKKVQREATKLAMADRDCPPLPPLPVIVTITRIGDRKMDDDNLATSCKYIRDQIAAAFGEDDGSDQYTWRYAQRIIKGSKGGVSVEITERTSTE